MVNHCIHRDGSLTGLTVTNNQLTLATANREHSINRHNTGHHRLIDVLTSDYPDCFALDEPASGVAPGQTVVVYEGDRVVGSAVIAEAGR